MYLILFLPFNLLLLFSHNLFFPFLKTVAVLFSLLFVPSFAPCLLEVLLSFFSKLGSALTLP